MTEHTPTPWTARSQMSKDQKSFGWILEHANGRIGWSSFATAVPNEGEGAPYVIGAANAAFIVRAVNSHDMLVEALQRLHDNLAEYQRINNLGGYDNQEMKVARNALELARGKAPQP
jgi:hypothetical protein